MNDIHAQIFQGVSEAILIIDAEGRIISANEAAHCALGYEPGEMEEGFLHELLHTAGNNVEGDLDRRGDVDEPADDRAAVPKGLPMGEADCAACVMLRDGKVHRNLTDEMRRKDGRVLTVKYNVVPLTGPEGPIGTAIAFRDITEQVRLKHELLRLKVIIEEAPAFISTADRDGNITFFNKTGRRWAGLPVDEQPKGWRLVPSSLRVAQRAAREGTWQGERQNFLGTRPGAQSGRTVLQTVMAHKDADGEVEFFTTIAIDVSEEKRLEQERLRLLAIIEESPDFISTADADGRILFLNRAGRRMVGVGPQEDISMLKIEDMHPEWAFRLIYDEGLPTAERVGQWHGETAVRDRNGCEIPVLQAIVAHKDKNGSVQYFSTIARDIAERKRMEERLSYLATHDMLTGVLNRASFQEHLQREIRQSVKTGLSGALLYFDLDNFKDINDSLGHHAGDELLQRISRNVRGHLRDDDALGRLGGDEFAILLPRTPLEDAQKIGQRLLAAINGETVWLEDRAIRLRASMGVATFPDEAATMTDVLVHADLAMYSAKRDGGNRVAVCDLPMESRREAISRLNMEQLCRDALQNDGFTLHWQPLADLREGRIVAYELLLRMRGANGKLYSPGKFLPVCERSELIHAIDRWVLRQALRCLHDLFIHKGPSVRLHVNLSRKTFSDETFVPFVRKQLDAMNVDPSRIVLEITETSAIENVDRATVFIQALRQMGFLFALDDFGVGFSTFGALRRLPVDMFKIDGSFIRDLPKDSINQHLVRAMVEVARGLGKQTVAEFVLDEPTVKLLAEFGVDYGQGYYIGRPGPVETSQAYSSSNPHLPLHG